MLTPKFSVWLKQPKERKSKKKRKKYISKSQKSLWSQQPEKMLHEKVLVLKVLSISFDTFRITWR